MVYNQKGCIMGNTGNSRTISLLHFGKAMAVHLSALACLLPSCVDARGLSQYHRVSPGTSESFENNQLKFADEDIEDQTG